MRKREISGIQCKMARIGLAIRGHDLAAQARVSRMTLSDFECGKRLPHPATIDSIRTILEKAGAIFIEDDGNGPGVRITRPDPSGSAERGSPGRLADRQNSPLLDCSDHAHAK